MKTNHTMVWLGHSAVKLTALDGTVIFIDPFLKNNPATPDHLKPVTKADFILLTHGHEDHVGDTLEIAVNTGARVIGNVELIGLLKADGLNQNQAVECNKGGTLHFNGFNVTMVNANHSSSNAGRYAGEAAGLVIRFDNGLCVYHMGDTNISSDFAYYHRLYKPDVLFIPIGDCYTMGPAEAALCCEMIRPSVAVPIHYGTWPPLTGDPMEFKKIVENHGTCRVEIPEAGQEFNF